VGYDYVHVAVDDHSRLAYVEVLTDERGTTCAGFLRRAGAFFAGYGITVERVMTDIQTGWRVDDLCSGRPPGEDHDVRHPPVVVARPSGAHPRLLAC
jgi:Integrase core domain